MWRRRNILTLVCVCLFGFAAIALAIGGLLGEAALYCVASGLTMFGFTKR